MAVAVNDFITAQRHGEMFDFRVFGGDLLQPGAGGIEARWKLEARQLTVLDALRPQRPRQNQNEIYAFFYPSATLTKQAVI